MPDPLNELWERIIVALDGWHRLYFVDEDDTLSGYESMADALAPLMREALAGAWDEGLDAGRDRWMGAREFGDPPVNPYRERS